MKNTATPLAIGIATAALIGGIFFIVNRSSISAPTENEHASSTSETRTGTSSAQIDLGNGVKVPASGEGVSIFPIENPSAKAPSLNRQFIVSLEMDASAKVSLQKKIDDLVASLKTDSEQLRLWTQLGGYLKLAGDYMGARDAWEYVAAAAPSNYVAFNNLGDLYMNYLKDFPKAETNYKKVITVKPEYIDSYRNLHTLYTYLYKTNTTAAKDILILGLSKNPDNKDLVALLEAYNKAHAQ